MTSLALATALLLCATVLHQRQWRREEALYREPTRGTVLQAWALCAGYAGILWAMWGHLG